MTKINFENDRIQSVEQIDSAKRLSDKILELKDLEDEISNAEESLKDYSDLMRNRTLIESMNNTDIINNIFDIDILSAKEYEDKDRK